MWTLMRMRQCDMPNVCAMSGVNVCHGYPCVMRGDWGIVVWEFRTRYFAIARPFLFLFCFVKPRRL